MTAAQERQIVRLLDKTTRVLDTVAQRVALLDFGQNDLRARVARLENAAVKALAAQKKARATRMKRK
jgi:hypothetical protein